MGTRTLLMLTAALAWALPAHAGLLPNTNKIEKKWDKEVLAVTKAFDVVMSQDEVDALVKMKTDDERKAFLTELGYWERWEIMGKDKDVRPLRDAIERGEVIEGMNQEQVFMAWNKPAKIRKDFRADAYVDVLNYEFEIPRKGEPFLLRPDSTTSYKNDVGVKYVYMFNDRVYSIVWEGEEEADLGELPGGPTEAAPEATPDEQPEAATDEGAPADEAKDAAAE